jgi:hypothetical protein
MLLYIAIYLLKARQIKNLKLDILKRNKTYVTVHNFKMECGLLYYYVHHTALKYVLL